MTPAEFEEREYERPLYHELEVADNRLWSPGQVLEGRVGLDTTFFSLGPFPLGLFGTAMPPGIIPSRYWHFFHHKLNVALQRPLPNFLLNVFLQAKRPRHLATSSKGLKSKGISGPHWAFAIDAEQQQVLELIEKKFQSRVIVTYAAPVFHTAKQLYARTIDGSVAKHSTFPAPSALVGGNHWHYKSPGATGVLNSEPRHVDGADLATRLNAVVPPEGPRPPEGSPGDHGNDWLTNLESLGSGIREVLSLRELPESFRRARFFETVRLLDARATRAEEPAWVPPYLTVIAFLQEYRASWFCVAQQ